MLTYITHIVVHYLFWKVCWLVSKVCWLISSIGMIERELVCWLTSPRFIFALSHKSMLTWITHGCVWNTLTYSMLTYITHIVVCYLFWKVCRLVSKVCWLLSSIGMIERELICWLTSPRDIFALSHISMLTWITQPLSCCWNHPQLS